MKRLLLVILTSLILTACEGDISFIPEDKSMQCGIVKPHGQQAIGRYCRYEEGETNQTASAR